MPPTWTKEELGKRSAIERFFGRGFLFFRLQSLPLSGWSAVASQVTLTYTASVIVGLAAQRADRPDLIRSPKGARSFLGWKGVMKRPQLPYPHGVKSTIRDKLALAIFLVAKPVAIH